MTSLMILLILVFLFGLALGAVLATLYHKQVVDDALKLSAEFQLALALAKSDLQVAEDKLKSYHTAVCPATETKSTAAQRWPQVGPGF